MLGTEPKMLEFRNSGKILEVCEVTDDKDAGSLNKLPATQSLKTNNVNIEIYELIRVKRIIIGIKKHFAV